MASPSQVYEDNSLYLTDDRANFPSNAPVAQKSRLRKQLDHRWMLIDDLLGGTERMRRAGERWLPKEPNEPIKAFRNRMQRSFLFNGFSDTIDKLTAKPFSRPVVIKPETVDPLISKMLENCDGEGTTLTQLGQMMYRNGTSHGFSFVFVDYATAPNASKADEQTFDLRPLMKFVDCRDILGWQERKTPNGGKELSALRFLECSTTQDGWDVKIEWKIRYITAPDGETKGKFEVWKYDGKSAWSKESEGDHTYPGIPLFAFYTKKTGFMKAAPPLQALAETNLCHWQSSSDHRNCLRMARFGMLSMTGLTKEEAEKGITVGPQFQLRSASKDATFGFVEMGGSSIKVGEEDLTKLEERMEILGMMPNAEKVTTTATGKNINETGKRSLAQQWVRNLEGTLTEALRAAYKWIGKEPPKDLAVDIFSDFAIDVTGMTEIEFLKGMRDSGDLTRPTLLQETKRRGILSDDVDIEKENAECDQDAQAFLKEALTAAKADPQGPPTDPQGRPSPKPGPTLPPAGGGA